MKKTLVKTTSQVLLITAVVLSSGVVTAGMNWGSAVAASDAQSTNGSPFKVNGTELIVNGSNFSTATLASKLQAVQIIPENIESIDFTVSTNLDKENTGFLKSFPNIKRISGCRFIKSKSLTNLDKLFEDNNNLDQIDIEKLDTSNVTSASNMFAGTQIKSIDLSQNIFNEVKNMSGMFKNTPLSNITLPKLTTHNKIDLTSAFENTQLKSIDLTPFRAAKSLNTENMFKDTPLNSFTAFKGLNLKNAGLRNGNWKNSKTDKSISLNDLISHPLDDDATYTLDTSTQTPTFRANEIETPSFVIKVDGSESDVVTPNFYLIAKGDQNNTELTEVTAGQAVEIVLSIPEDKQAAYKLTDPTKKLEATVSDNGKSLILKNGNVVEISSINKQKEPNKKKPALTIPKPNETITHQASKPLPSFSVNVILSLPTPAPHKNKPTVSRVHLTIFETPLTIATHEKSGTISLYDSNFKKIPARSLAPKSDWLSDRKKSINGKTFYRVSAKEWVDGSDIYSYESKQNTITTKDGYHKDLLKSDGTKSNRRLVSNSTWSSDRTTVINGILCHRVSTNEFVANTDIIIN
ncbi:BspA family leucine-rich repeat surface protein [Companilactobacillus sp.]|uniref:BspA family leucine-rich repeat surface protein n=1 Tax=Companilactobacillus sp. TaxID=2767905 RepID=UPI00262BD91F|nr:BspA family leucine-rich repeat surface protein [Companilactobacillus sp.]